MLMLALFISSDARRRLHHFLPMAIFAADLSPLISSFAFFTIR